MGLKQYVVDLSGVTAENAVAADIQKLLLQLQNQNAATSGQILEVTGPNQFKVLVNGQPQTLTYTGNRPVSPGGTVFLNGQYCS